MLEVALRSTASVILITFFTASSDDCGKHLLTVLRDIFSQYANIVGDHHRKLLETIPQQVALYHNNCMFISHTVMQLNKTYQNKLKKSVLICPPIFNDQAYTLRKCGIETFSNYTEEQIRQIQSIVGESGLKGLKTGSSLGASTEKSIRECLRKQELLKTVWQKVLPATVYNKTLGHILDSFCNFLINAVVGVPDISVEAAELLITIYNIVISRAPKLFSDPTEISLYVESWNKLNELVFVLDSNMLNINDRWASGKGPLALYFKPEEVKDLIRALFQNTDLRANMLNRITLHS